MSNCSSNSNEKTGACPSTKDVTRGPLPASKKVYVGDLKVPMREIALEGGKTFTVYDPSGPFTDNVELDIMRGIPKTRTQWIVGRGDVEDISKAVRFRRSITA
jgi:phosphomethylpyrimidine synthase